MLHMSPYAFETMLQQQAVQHKRQRLEFSKRSEQKTGSLAASFFQREGQELENKAYHVLEALLKHENEEIRLKAAAVILESRAYPKRKTELGRKTLPV